MKKLIALLVTGFLSAESLIIVDSLGLQRAKAEITDSADIEIKLQKSGSVKLTNSTESLSPSESGQKIIFKSVTPGKWKVESESKILEVKVLR